MHAAHAMASERGLNCEGWVGGEATLFEQVRSGISVHA